VLVSGSLVGGRLVVISVGIVAVLLSAVVPTSVEGGEAVITTVAHAWASAATEGGGVAYYLVETNGCEANGNASWGCCLSG
jgi:hypothetical protein